MEQAYRKLLEKFSSDRWNHNNCEGEFGLYYDQKRKEQAREEEEEEDENNKYNIKVRIRATHCCR